MKKLKIAIVSLTALLLSTSSFAQQQKEKTKTKEETSEIVIRKKGDNKEKMTIVVDGEKVTINGKPIDEFKDENVKVLKRNRSIAISPRTRIWNAPGEGFNIENFESLIPAAVNKAMLGVRTSKVDDGAKIGQVTKESGAEKAGLQKDDVITKVGSTSIKEPNDLTEAISKYNPNDKVEITYLRNGKENKATVTLGENKASAYSFNLRDDDFNFEFPHGDMVPGLENYRLNYNRKPKIGLQIQDVEEGKGVKVREVDEESPASKAGLKEGDVITQVNGKEIEGVDELRSEIKDLKEGDAVKINYNRAGKSSTAEIKIPKRLKTANL